MHKMNSVNPHQQLHYRVVPMTALTTDLRLRWLALLNRVESCQTPFLHPTFASFAAEAGRPVQVVVAERDGRAVAFFPCERSGRLATPVAARLSDYQGVVQATPGDWSPREFARQTGIRQFRFDHLLSAEGTFPGRGYSAHRSPVVDLPDGFAAYREGLKQEGNKHLEQILQKYRKAERECGPLRFTLHDPRPEVLEQLVAWKQSQYARTGVLDVFRHAWAKSLVCRLAQHREEGFGGLVSTLHAGEELVAVHLGLFAGSTLHYWFPAYHGEHACSRHSPGLLLVALLLQHLAEQGLTRLDFGRGEERYKRELPPAIKVWRKVPLAPALPSIGPPQCGSAVGSWPAARRSVAACRSQCVGGVPGECNNKCDNSR
jgi:CelD/BcsL family acetyltransferase involved in cellulose biosynthesis